MSTTAATRTPSETDELRVWHYGLTARSWIVETDLGENGAFFQRIVEQSGDPALDVGCGGGRLLVPLREAGLDVDGSDYANDMLDVCRDALQRAGLEARLYRQGMHQLDLPRRYRTIYACGVVGLGGRKDLTRQGFARIRDHLRPGGLFVFDYEVPWNDPGYWSGWQPENRRDLPLDWFPPHRVALPNGDELENAVQIVSQNPLEAVTTRAIRHRLYRDGELIEEDVHAIDLEMYTKHELALMLETAGFATVEVRGGYTDEPATDDHENIVFIAHR